MANNFSTYFVITDDLDYETESIESLKLNVRLQCHYG